MITIFVLLIFSLQSINGIHGCECGADSLVEYGENGLPTSFPWTIYLRIDKYNRVCVGMVLSPTELVTYGCKFDKEDQVSIFNNQKHIFKNMKYPGLYLPLKTIKTPKWVDVDNEYNILILDAPLENGITPICMSSSNKKSTPKLLAFNGEQSYHDNNSDDPMHPVIDITKLETNMPSMNALSYKKDGKWYFFGVRYYLGFAWPMSDIFKPVTFGTSTLSKKIHACDNQ